MLLRVHRPNLFGDIITRSTFLRAKKTQKLASGIELGATFFSLRSVKPVSYLGKQIGYMEVAEEIDHVFHHMKEVNGIDVGVFLTDKYLSQHTTDLQSESVAEFKLLSPTNQAVTLHLAMKLVPSMRHALKEQVVTISEHDEKTYVIGMAPFRDDSGATVGILFFHKDVTSLFATMWRGVITNVLILSFIVLNALVILFLTYRKLNRKLEQSLAEVKQRQNRLQSLSPAIDQSPTSVMITGADAVIQYVNPCFSMMTGYTLEEAVGQTPRILKSGETDPAVFTEFWNNLLRGDSWKGTFINRRKSGELYWEEALVAPVRDAEGTTTHYVAVLIDISQRKTSEELILQQQQELEKLNAHLTEMVEAEITKNREKDIMLIQQEKLASIGQLAAGVAHEINNPIAYVSGNLKILTGYFKQVLSFDRFLKEQLHAMTPCQRESITDFRKTLDLEYILGDAESLIEDALDGTNRVTKIVLDLKTFSRVDTSEVEPMQLGTCLDTALNICYNELHFVAEITREYRPVPDILCHPGQLNQVFLNLFINAGQSIVPPGKIHIKCWHDDVFVYASISDTGKGIPEEFLGRIFEPFYTTKDVGKGTGLGLSISLEIIRKHQGEILVESKVGTGTTFTIKLPRTPNNIITTSHSPLPEEIDMP